MHKRRCVNPDGSCCKGASAVSALPMGVAGWAKAHTVAFNGEPPLPGAAEGKAEGREPRLQRHAPSSAE